ncbi:MAG: hypothetical protein ACLFNO_03425 [Parcubacteria group bacterium]
MEELIVFLILSIFFLVLFIIDIARKTEKKWFPGLWLSVFILIAIATIAFAANHPEAVKELTAILNF